MNSKEVKKDKKKVERKITVYTTRTDSYCVQAPESLITLSTAERQCQSLPADKLKEIIQKKVEEFKIDVGLQKVSNRKDLGVEGKEDRGQLLQMSDFISSIHYSPEQFKRYNDSCSSNKVMRQWLITPNSSQGQLVQDSQQFIKSSLLNQLQNKETAYTSPFHSWFSTESAQIKSNKFNRPCLKSVYSLSLAS